MQPKAIFSILSDLTNHQKITKMPRELSQRHFLMHFCMEAILVQKNVAAVGITGDAVTWQLRCG